MQRKICIVTGTRAEYGLLKPVMVAIQKHPGLKLQLIVSGMHLLPEFGCTVTEVEEDGFKIEARVEMIGASDTTVAMTKSVGLGIIGMSQALEQLKPDVVLVLGDRIEPLAATIAASFMNIPVAHMSGGQVTGSIDESVRHAITKFAHIHFPRTPEHGQGLLCLGEEPERIHVVGSPCLDTILSRNYLSPQTVVQKYGVNLEENLLLVIQHPITTEVSDATSQMRETMEALVELREQTILIYPNADAGGRSMVKVIVQYKDCPLIKMYTNIPQGDYYGIMNVADLMIGNSSSAFTEAPMFRLPAINIGARQIGRESAGNVVNVGYDKDEIVKMARRILTDSEFNRQLKDCLPVYGDGKTGEKIADILSRIDLRPELLRKKLVIDK